MSTIISAILHLDRTLGDVIAKYGVSTHALLAVIIFAETGLVVTPFLPGDSLLFAAGAFAATGALDLTVLLVILPVAAILGDSVNYSIGRRIGDRVLREGRLLGVPVKREYLERTQRFYAKYGNKAIVLARFVPIIRTFVPFVAGVGKMEYRHFAFYNIAGGLVWTIGFTLAGYFFGNIPAVKERFSLVIMAIIALSLMPIVIEWIRARKNPAA